jgi:KipI family sensor histidine kinase inhibitor
VNPGVQTAAADAAIEFEALADDAWLLRLGEVIDDALNARIHALTARLRTRAPAWLRDLVPAYASLAVFFDNREIDADAVRDWLQVRCAQAPDVVDRLEPLDSHTVESRTVESRTVEIPVAYGGEFGPDLATSAAELGLSAAALIQRHSEGVYTVAMIGFAPGFPYLSGLDPELALPRLATPRTQVAAGSVAIGGAQTGIYPRPGPGGWRLLGRTPLSLFDPSRAQPSLLLPGDRVRFLAIDAAQFARLQADA